MTVDETCVSDITEAIILKKKDVGYILYSFYDYYKLLNFVELYVTVVLCKYFRLG
jgi:hypothetical protein